MEFAGTLLGAIPDVVAVLDATSGRVLYRNHALDGAHDPVTGADGEFFQSVHPDDVARVRACAIGVAQGASTEGCIDYRCRGGPGWRWLQTRFVRDPSTGGRAHQLVAVSRDISDLKAAQHRAEESEQQYRLLAEHATDLVTRTALDGTVFWVSPSVRDLLGYEPEEYVGKLLSNLVHPEDLTAVLTAREEARGGTPSRFTARIRHQNGAYRWLETTVQMVDPSSGRVVELRGAGRDVTDRVQTTAALAEAEHRLSQTFARAPIGLALVGIDGRWLQVNDALCEIVGYRREQLLKMNFQDIMHPDDLAEDLDQLRRLLAGEATDLVMEKRYVHAADRVVWVRLSIALARDAHVSPLHFIVQVQDITEARRQHEALVESEERHRLLAENSSDIIMRIAPTGELLWTSPALERTLGRPPAVARLLDVPAGAHSDDRAAVQRAVDQAFAGRDANVTFRAPHADGHWVWLETYLRPAHDADGQLLELHLVARDVTERERARQELEQLALTDPLTGLANRTRLIDRTRQSLARSKRAPGPWRCCWSTSTSSSRSTTLGGTTPATR